MNKKSLIVIIIAAILALIAAIIIFNPYKAELLKQTKQNIKETSTSTVIELEQTKTNEDATIPDKAKPTQKLSPQPTNKASYKKPAPKPTISEPVIKPLVVKEAEVTPEPIQNADIIVDDKTHDIIVNKEYKIHTPSKYTFK